MQNSQFTLLAGTTGKAERLHDFLVHSSTVTEEANKQRHNLDANPSSSTTKKFPSSLLRYLHEGAQILIEPLQIRVTVSISSSHRIAPRRQLSVSGR